MPTNKNALARYRYLDEMLASRHHFYDIHDLTERCNERLVDDGLPTVTQRCVEKDLNFIECEPFGGEIERFVTNGKHCIRYADPSFSIFHKKLSEEESNLLLEVLNTIGQFDGLPHFEWIDDFKKRLGGKDRPKIISFSNNPYLRNTNLLGVLFDYISNQIVVKLDYRAFLAEENNVYYIHPYLIKQYNNRWYLIGSSNDNGKIWNCPLDRIEAVAPAPEIEFRPCEENLAERFEDIVGVTLYDDRPIEHIIFWVSSKDEGYVLTKPIHESQKHFTGEKDAKLRETHPMLTGGSFFSIDCIPNYELIRELTSYGCDLVVLSPDSIQSKVYQRVNEQEKAYACIFLNKN